MCPEDDISNDVRHGPSRMLHYGFSQLDQDISGRWFGHVHLYHFRGELSGLIVNNRLVLGGKCVSHGDRHPDAVVEEQ